jgi:cysteine desulfurase
LYIKNGVKVEKLVGGGEQERGLRGGTSNIAGIVGLATAYKKTVGEMEETEAKMQTLRLAFLRGLDGLDGIRVNGDPTGLPSILNLRIEGVSNTAFLYRMDLQGVCLAAGSACASASVKPSHVLTAMGLDEKGAKESVRFSFGKNNTQEEIVQGAKLVVETVMRLR